MENTKIVEVTGVDLFFEDATDAMIRDIASAVGPDSVPDPESQCVTQMFDQPYFVKSTEMPDMLEFFRSFGKAYARNVGCQFKHSEVYIEQIHTLEH